MQDKVSILHSKLSEQDEYMVPHLRDVCYSAMQEYADIQQSTNLEKIKELEAEIETLRTIAHDVATFSYNNVTTIDLKRKAQFYFKQYPLKPQEK